MQISAKELASLASDVDDQHNEAMRDFSERISDAHVLVARGARRSFMKKAGLAGASGAALTMFGGSLLPSFAGFSSSAGAQGLTDTVIAGYAQSVELAAVAAYTAAAPGLKGSPTLAVATLFAGHHQAHADAFGAAAGNDARPEANPKLVAAVTPTLTTVSDAVKAGQAGTPDLVEAILKFAQGLENQAAYTYAAALTALTDAAYAAATSTILPIEAQHATVIAIARGKGIDEMFPTGPFESAAFGDGTDLKAGFDPAVFA